MKLQKRINEYTRKWEDAGQWVTPDIQDCVSFMCTEAGEALDEILKMKCYVRNHPVESSYARLREEVADTAFMALVTANEMGFDLGQEIMDKLKGMDAKKKAARKAGKNLNREEM